MLWIACAIAQRYQAPYCQPLPITVRLCATETSRQALERMAQWALQFTPSVALEPSRDVLLMEVSASLRLWGGKDALLDRLAKGWVDMGWHGPDSISMAYAATPKAAHWQAYALSQQPDCGLPAVFTPDINHLPIDASQEALPHRETFSRMGIHSLGQLCRLPRSGLVRRFGAQLLGALDQARGQSPDPRAWILAAPKFHRQLELPARADNWRLIELGAQRLFDELSAWLIARQLGLQKLELLLKHDSPPHSCIVLGFADAVYGRKRLMTVLSERLVREKLSRPVYEIELHVNELHAISQQTSDLLSDQPMPTKQLSASFVELIERLQSRLGAEHVQQLKLYDDHRPEAAQHAQHIAQAGQAKPQGGHQSQRKNKPLPASIAPSTSLMPEPTESHRPTWLLGVPLALKISGQKPIYHGPLQLLCGPERIESGWWEDDPGAMALRDYFIASSPDGELVWIYRTPSHEWYLHGIFS